MVLFVHNSYRTRGGEERVVESLMALVRQQLGEPAQLLRRDSGASTRAGAATALLRGGSDPDEVVRAIARTGARVLHAHNLLPTLGWRSLAAARAAGVRTVLHLHQYRLVCAIGVGAREDGECLRCHGRNTLPGVALRCRGSTAESLAYGLSLALWQRRTIAEVDAFIVPSVFARERLRELGAPLPWERVHVLAPPLAVDAFAPAASVAGDAGKGGYALVAARLAHEKGVDVAIDACRIAGMPLVIAGDGPELAALRERAGGAAVTFAGRCDAERLAELRRGAVVALAPSRFPETFGMSVAEAMAARVPVLASAIGAHAELLDDDALVPVDDAPAMARAIDRVAGDVERGSRGRARIAALCDPAAVAAALARIYDAHGGGEASS